MNGPPHHDGPRVEQGVRPGAIVMSGEFDLTGHGLLHTTLAEALARLDGDPAGNVVLDMHAVSFVDIRTVRVLLDARQAAADAGRRLRVTGAGGAVRRVLEVCDAWQRLVGEDTDDGLVEIHANRRALLADLRTKLRTDPQALAADEFLAVADAATVQDAILMSAIVTGAADACDLQTYDPRTDSLYLARQRGFTQAFVDYFATVDATRPSACGIALATREPVIIDDITRSPIFAGQPTLDVVLAAGTRAVQSYPLHDETGQLLGMLSLHYHSTRPREGQPQRVAETAARALARVPA